MVCTTVEATVGDRENNMSWTKKWRSHQALLARLRGNEGPGAALLRRDAELDV